MKLDSHWFDCIRVKPDQDRRRPDAPPCQWEGCTAAGTHRAPKGRGAEGQYWHFCLEHVREYNKSYNYFAGMDDEAIAAFQKSATIGHRPTWSIGVNSWAHHRVRRAHAGREGRAYWGAQAATDPFDLFGAGRRSGASARSEQENTRTVSRAAAKCFDTLSLDVGATAAEIKARYKELVKRHHPDANGGDRSTEDRLREVIQAYGYLKSAGFC